MAMERKRSPFSEYAGPPEAAASTSSARARHAANSRSLAFTNFRSESPPASAYFSHFSGDHHEEPQPTLPDASAHFAYSTTLRRHTLDGPLGLPHPTPGSGISSLGELRTVVENEGARGLWERTGGRLIAAFSQRDPYERIPTRREEPPQAQKESASARFAHCSIQDTLAHFGTSASDGLPSRRVQELLATHGYNEFSVSTPEPLFVKFAKTIYENPLILLLCGSAVVSAVMGNIDDSVSITVAVLIVLTVSPAELMVQTTAKSAGGMLGELYYALGLPHAPLLCRLAFGATWSGCALVQGSGDGDSVNSTHLQIKPALSTSLVELAECKGSVRYDKSFVLT